MSGVYDNLLKELLEEAKLNSIKAANTLLDDANEIVPVQSGKLKDSGHVTQTKDGIEVVYDADYALTVHENPNSTGYKFLERTADLNVDKYVEIISKGD